MHGQRFARDMTIAVLALVFSVLFIWYSRNTGASGFRYWAPFVLAGVALLLGIPVYFAQRGKMTEPEPVPSTAERKPPGPYSSAMRLGGQPVQAGEHQPGRVQRGGLRRVPRVRDGDDLQSRGRRGPQPVRRVLDRRARLRGQAQQIRDGQVDVGGRLPRLTCSVDSATLKHSRRPAPSSTALIRAGGDELASPSGQRVASSLTAPAAPGISGAPSW